MNGDELWMAMNNEQQWTMNSDEQWTMNEQWYRWTVFVWMWTVHECCCIVNIGMKWMVIKRLLQNGERYKKRLQLKKFT